jgi:hypothetical protein
LTWNSIISIIISKAIVVFRYGYFKQSISYRNTIYVKRERTRMKHRGRGVKAIPLNVGNDPSLWRYQSVADALSTNCDLLTQLIREGEEICGAPDLSQPGLEDTDIKNRVTQKNQAK